MTTYRHAVSDDGFCGVCIYDGDSPICADPTPDPASPCGAVIHRSDGRRPYTCTSVEAQTIHRMWPIEPHHEFAATRCVTCGHAVEPAP